MKGVLSKAEAECLGVMKSTMAGMAVGKFWDVLEDAFGYDEEAHDEPDPPSPVQLEREADLPAAAKTTKAAAEKAQGGAKRKSSTPSRRPKKPKGVGAPPISLSAAQIIFPTNADRYHYAGNPGPFIGARKTVKMLTTGEIRGVYSCQYTQVAGHGKELPSCNYVNESRLQMAQHVREYHMGIALGCWVCQLAGKEYKVYGGKAWMDHMRRFHGQTHREAEFFKPAHLNLSVVQLDDEISLPDFLRLLSEQQPEGVTVTTSETAGSVEMKLEVPASSVEPSPAE